jgi:hypothetical protein
VYRLILREFFLKTPLTVGVRNDNLISVLRLSGRGRMTHPSRKQPKRFGGGIEGTAKREFAAEGWQRLQFCDTAGFHVGTKRIFRFAGIRQGRGYFFAVKGLTAREGYDTFSNRR